MLLFVMNSYPAAGVTVCIKWEHQYCTTLKKPQANREIKCFD